MNRAQANLTTLVVALLVVSGTTVVGLVVAQSAMSGADRQPGERRTAVGLSERLVGPSGPLTARANVLNADTLAALNATSLQARYPLARDRAVTVTLAGRTLAETGDTTGGTTIRRVVLVQRRTAVTLAPPLWTDDGHAVTLPRRSHRVDLRIDPPSGTTVRTVRANSRIVLHNESGLSGNFTVDLSRFETTRLTFDARGSLPAGSVELTYYPASTTKAVLAVTVDG